MLSARECYNRMMSKTDFENCENTVANYDSYTEYDSDIVAYGHFDNVPAMAVEILTKYKSKNCRILDVACGSGIVGHHLRKQGYCGVIEGIDGSSLMLKECRKKKIYDSLFQKILKPDTSLIVADNFELYDAVFCIAGFGDGHIHFDVMKQILSILADDGILIFSFRRRSQSTTGKFEMQLKAMIQKLEQDNIVRKKEEISVEKFYNVSSESNNDTQCGTGTLFCFEKCQ